MAVVPALSVPVPLLTSANVTVPVWAPGVAVLMHTFRSLASVWPVASWLIAPLAVAAPVVLATLTSSASPGGKALLVKDSASLSGAALNRWLASAIGPGVFNVAVAWA